eukprot:3818547-Pleurochrysis_carterae.AAC.7
MSTHRQRGRQPGKQTSAPMHRQIWTQWARASRQGAERARAARADANPARTRVRTHAHRGESSSGRGRREKESH